MCLCTKSIQEIAYDCYANSAAHGFWENNTNIAEKLMLIVSEASEALECWRNGESLEERLRDTDGKPEGFASELADVVIRVFDLAVSQNIDIQSAIEHKMEYNKSRPFMHGKIA